MYCVWCCVMLGELYDVLCHVVSVTVFSVLNYAGFVSAGISEVQYVSTIRVSVTVDSEVSAFNIVITMSSQLCCVVHDNKM